MRRTERLIAVVIIALGLLFIIWATSQIDIDTGRNLHKWGRAMEAVEQE
jgi:hypothetical protein